MDDHLFPDALVRSDPALLSFSHEGRTAHIRVVDGQIVYEGDLSVAESARLLFEELRPYLAEGKI